MKRFWDYWKENFEIAKAGKEFAAIIILVVVYIGLLFCRWYGLQNEYVKEWDKYFGYGETGLTILFATYALMWLPVKRHELEKRKHETETDALRIDIHKLEKTIADHDKTEEKRKAKVNILNIIGALRIDIGNRRGVIMMMSNADYYHTLEENGTDLEMDSRWNFINDTLKREMGLAALSEFASVSDFEKTKLEGQDASEFQTEMRRKRIYALDLLRHMDRKLQKLTENIDMYFAK